MDKKLFFKWLMFLSIFFPSFIFAQNVSGKITDEATNMPIGGANVIVKGTTTGAISDFDGNYSIQVNSFPAVLVFSYLGYETKEATITSASTLNVSLLESATALNEVVITGLATSVKRSNAANAVASISSEDLVGRTPPQTLDGALAGKFTGALVSASSGAPGGGLSVKLRGVTSINGNAQPLYIIDGVYVNNNSIAAPGLNAVSGAASGGSASNQDNPSNRIADINPEDIANIEILKGASASAIYGSRAAAGVIIITTKKGKQGTTKINFSQAFGYNEVINLQGQRNWSADLAESAYGEGALYTQAQNNGTLRDYEKEIFGEKGFISNTNISISGGNEKTSFFGAFTNNEEDGIVKRTGADKKSFRLNLDHKVTDNIKLSATSNYISSSADRGFFNNDNSGATLGVALTSTRPWDNLFPDSNGNYPDHPNNSSNPIHTRDVMTNNEKVSRLIAGASLDVNLWSTEKHNLKMILRAGFDSYTLKTNVFFPRDLQFMRPDQGGLDGVTAEGTTVNKDANFSAFLVHNFYTDNNITFTTQAGLTNERFSRNTSRITSSGLIASENNVDQAANIGVSQFRLEQEDAGFFVQEEVNYQDKIIATLGLRGDKSSNNGDANEFFYYPKASAAINLHSFDFWSINELNQFKIRAAYGEAGNFAPNGALFTTYTNSLINGNVGIITPPTLGDPTIQPERQKEFEIGFDAGLLNNRIALDFTVYNKKVEDLILLANNQPSSGFTTRFSNAGSLQNKGVEIGLNVNAFDSENFSWDSGISWFKNKSEITELTVDAFDTGGFGTGLGTFRIEEGKSATQIVGNDINGDVVVLGDAEPDFQMSFTNNIRYKDFTLSFLWHWKKGGDNINLSKLLSDFGGTSADYDDTNLDPSGTLNNGDYRISGFSNGFASPFVEDASYLRLREIGLYYSIPQNTLQKLFKGNVSDVKVGLSANNLINIFDYNSYDPEVSNFGQNGLSTGVEVTPFPSSKRILFHLAVGF